MSSKQIVSNAEAIIIMLVDFSYHQQINGWGWISFHLKEENAWDIIFSTREVFFSRGQVLVFIKKKLKTTKYWFLKKIIFKGIFPHRKSKLINATYC